MMLGRLVCLAVLPLAAACASAPSGAPTVAPDSVRSASALPPQTLAEGRCGIFLFELREPNAFVFFEDESAAIAKIFQDGAVVEAERVAGRSSFAPGDAFTRSYERPGLGAALTGRLGEETGSGLRVEDAVLRVRRPDGTEIVRPLGGVRSCRD